MFRSTLLPWKRALPSAFLSHRVVYAAASYAFVKTGISSPFSTAQCGNVVVPSKPPRKQLSAEELRAQLTRAGITCVAESQAHVESPLTDSFGRVHNYLRISLTEKCNLRCQYCMPEEGTDLTPASELLTSQEIVDLARFFVESGVTKIRFTGGEPLVRKDIVEIIEQVATLKPIGLKTIAITTNAILLPTKLDALLQAGLTAVNISLDTMDPLKFTLITRRKGHERVVKAIQRCIDAGVRTKVNVVVIRGINDMEILDFVEMTKDKPIEVRFIEYMPFDGNKWSEGKMVTFEEMKERVKAKYPTFTHGVTDKDDDKVSKVFQVPGWKGTVGFISSMTEHFCDTCNRLRLTADGNLKVCLFGATEVNLRDLLRSEAVTTTASGMVSTSTGGDSGRSTAGRLQGQGNADSSMTNEEQLHGNNHHNHGTMSMHMNTKALLRDVVRAAVQRKKARHAGMTLLQLNAGKNRPMVKIGG